MRKLCREADVFERKAFYSPQEVAELVGLSTSTILNYIHGEKLYAVKLSERTYRIPLASVLGVFFPEEKAPPKLISGSDAIAAWRRWEREWRGEHERSPRRRRAMRRARTPARA